MQYAQGYYLHAHRASAKYAIFKIFNADSFVQVFDYATTEIVDFLGVTVTIERGTSSGCFTYKSRIATRIPAQKKIIDQALNTNTAKGYFD